MLMSSETWHWSVDKPTKGPCISLFEMMGALSGHGLNLKAFRQHGLTTCNVSKIAQACIPSDVMRVAAGCAAEVSAAAPSPERARQAAAAGKLSRNC